ncbi:MULTISPECIES: hypothetical protein [unclassified Adlercreutzia]|uniref:hypothetical protein n=1 Tax=unclassified Adlercreutzia TaxID=2636013 RepID=UPI0013ECC969|nr:MULTISPECIES: hypothetical protein [unclassified Adlercreutzia]
MALSCERTCAQAGGKARFAGVAALFAVAVVCIAVAGVGAASAYFTTYCQAKGGYTLELGDTTTVEENFANWTKSVTIQSDAASDEAVYVRVRAYGPSEYPITYSEPGGAANWSLAADGYYYYRGTLDPGATTPVLDLRINDVPVSGADAAPAPQPGDAFNVVVIYETTPVQYQPDGATVEPEAADWSVKLETGNAGDASEGGER